MSKVANVAGVYGAYLKTGNEPDAPLDIVAVEILERVEPELIEHAALRVELRLGNYVRKIEVVVGNQLIFYRTLYSQVNFNFSTVS